MEVIKKVKELIGDYYLGQEKKIYIPEDILNETFSLFNGKKVEQFIIFRDNILKDAMIDGILKNKTPPECIIRQHIAIKNAKQIDGCKEIFSNKEQAKHFHGIALLSNVNIETMPELYSFTLFDEKIAIVLEKDDDGGYFITKDKVIIDICKKWLSLDFIDKQEIELSFLQEPLMMSADMMSEVSSVLCTHDHMNLSGCGWYHSVWQYLRLMNMVSTPTWHHDFYLENLQESLKNKSKPNVLISGAADYSTLSYTIRAMELLGEEATYSVLDLCETPLFACKWYAKRKQVSLETKQISIFDLDDDSKYDLICTDAFLTRFSQDKILQILNIWYKALKEGGSVVTTVRIHDEKHQCPSVPSEQDVNAFAIKAYERSKIWGGVINYSPEEIAQKARVYASKMKSNRIGTREEILELFQRAGFKLQHLEDIEVDGELYPSRYLRIRVLK